MNRAALTEAIPRLVQHATDLIATRYVPDRHQIGAAILAADGEIYDGIHVEAMVGRASICAEAVGLGRALMAGTTPLELLVAVRHPKPTEVGGRPRVVPPCGLCREILPDYAPGLRVVIDRDGVLRAVTLPELLPDKYQGTKWSRP